MDLLGNAIKAQVVGVDALNCAYLAVVLPEEGFSIEEIDVFISASASLFIRSLYKIAALPGVGSDCLLS